jgi:hypothetical protein
MRRIVPSVLVAAAVSLLAGHALAGEAKGLWEGCGVGSFVHQKMTMTMSMAGVPPTTTEMKSTLVKVTDAAWTVKTETKVGEEWMGAEMDYPRKATGTAPDAPKPEDLGEEKVTVEGKDLACKKQQVKVGDQTVTTWTNDTYGVVRSESKGAGSETSSVLTKLAGKTKVGDREVEYRETTTTAKSAGSETKMVTWQSDAVPGHVLRTESVADMGAMKSTTVTETVAFEVK